MFAPQPKGGESSPNKHIPVFADQKATGHSILLFAQFSGRDKTQRLRDLPVKAIEGKTCSPGPGETKGIPPWELSFPQPPGSRAGLPLSGTKSISALEFKSPFCPSSGWTRPWTNGALSGVKTGHRGTRCPGFSNRLSKHGLVLAGFLQSLLAKILGLPGLAPGPWLVPCESAESDLRGLFSVP